MRKLLIALLTLGLAIVIGVGVSMYLLAPPDLAASYPRMQWLSQHGDFYGGFAGPLLTFLTFVGLLFTINLQLEESAESKKRNETQERSIHKQNFEMTFFQMLDIHTSIIADLHWKDAAGRVLNGRSCFEGYRDELFRLNSNNPQALPERQHLVYIYTIFWNTYRQALGHYFRYLYNLIRFVDSTDDIDKQRYIRIVRAQISDYELVIIFYNCLTARGEKLKGYVEKYTLLDNLAPELLLSQTQIGYLALSAYKASTDAGITDA